MILPKNIFLNKENDPFFWEIKHSIIVFVTESFLSIFPWLSSLTLIAFLSSYASYTGPGIIKPTTTFSKFPVSSDFKQSTSSWMGIKIYCYLLRVKTVCFYKFHCAEKLEIFLLRYIHSYFKIHFHTFTNLTSQKENETWIWCWEIVFCWDNSLEL